MRTALEGARRGTPRPELLSERQEPAALLKEIVHWLDEAKAEEVVTIDLIDTSPYTMSGM
jgi:ribosome-associated protein